MEHSSKTSKYPLVSVVIPTYNSAKFIIECVESVLSQTYPNFEVIVLDDGSTDETEELLKPYSQKIQYIKKTNGGLASARNAGFMHTKGEYIAWLDADDIAHIDRLMIQADFLSNHPEIILVSSNFTAFNEEGPLPELTIESYYGMIKNAGAIGQLYPTKKKYMPLQAGPRNTSEKKGITAYYGKIRDKLIWGNFIHPPTVMIRRSAYLKAGNLDETIPTSEDWYFFVKLSRQGEIGHLDIPLLQYRISDNQMSAPQKNAEKIVTNIIRTMEIIADEEHALVGQDINRLKANLSLFHSNAAYVFSETKPSHALYHLWKSLRYDFRMTKGIKKILAKIFLPNFLLTSYRNLK